MPGGRDHARMTIAAHGHDQYRRGHRETERRGGRRGEPRRGRTGKRVRRAVLGHGLGEQPPHVGRAEVLGDGRLEVAAAAAWGVLPRSHFNGLYQLSGGATLDGRVSADLSWLLCLMTEAPPSRVIFLSPREDSPLILYTDASGSPANGLGAVLVDGEEVLWTSCRCPDRVLGLFRQRKTQINLLEVCGVILGLWTCRTMILQTSYLLSKSRPFFLQKRGEIAE